MASACFTFFMLLWVGHKIGHAKECTNVPTEQVSHTMRALALDRVASHTNFPTELSDSRADKKYSTSAYMHPDHLDRFSVRDAEKSSELMSLQYPRIPLAVFSSLNSNQEPELKEVSLHRVTLAADSLQGKAQQTNLLYLLMLEVDDLVWSFRVTAGLPAPGKPYGGWELPTSELRGHFVGHYLSATALMWASTHNSTLLEKMTTLVHALEECQDRLGTGYLSAFPAEFFDRFEAIEPVWAPYYTIHKIMAGLLDQYTFAGNRKAFNMLLRMAKYFLKRVETLIFDRTIEQHWNSLNEEVGGMNDVMYRLFRLTGNSEHLKLAHLFDKPCFLGLLALQTDGLSGFHSNTHIPLVVGAQMRHEATGDNLYKEIGEYFMSIIDKSHRYATGGTSVGEFWSLPNRLGDTLDTENQESCTTYNMLKIARNLFRWTKDVSYADYYERALVNGVLGIQRGEEPGVMIYMLPQGPGTSKSKSYHGWGNPFHSFWCCYGTGIESFSKLGDSIYFEDQRNELSLYVVQFVSSNISWDAMGLFVTQKVQPLSSEDSNLRVIFQISELSQGANKGKIGDLCVRFPSWTNPRASRVSLNGLSFKSRKAGRSYATQEEGSYLTISRAWKVGDTLKVDLPISLSLEKIQDDRSNFSTLHAVLFGPYLLVGMTEGENVIGAVDTSSPTSWLAPVPSSYNSQLYSFSQEWSTDIGALDKADSDARGSRNQNFVLGHDSISVEMMTPPRDGTNEAAQCTFLLTELSLVTSKEKEPSDELPLPLVEAAVDPEMGTVENVGLNYAIAGRVGAFELFSKPGRFLGHTGRDGVIVVVDKPSTPRSPGSFSNLDLYYSWKGESEVDNTIFRIIPGLSAGENTVSFEAATLPGCFITSALDPGITLRCQSEHVSNDPHFHLMASFTVNPGLASYHPISFFAKGQESQYLLFPIHAYRDEMYATYFNFTQ